MYTAILLLYSSLLLLIGGNMIVKRKFPYAVICVVIIASLCILTYFYHPSASADLSRLNVWIQEIQNHSVSKDTIEKAQLDVLWLEKLYFQFIALFRFYNAFPIISIAIELTVIFYVYKRMGMDLRLNTRFLMMALLFFLFTWDYLNAASGIRFLLACSMLTAVLYFDLIKKKNTFLCYTLYIALCFFHVIAILVIILRTVSFFCRTGRGRYLIYSGLLLHYIILDKLIWFFGMLPLGNLKTAIMVKIRSMLWKMEIMPFSKRLLVKIPLAVALVVMLMIFLRYYQNTYKNYKNYAVFLGAVLVLGLGSLYYYDLFLRMTAFAYIAFIPLYWIMYIESRKQRTGDTAYQRLCTKLSVYFVNLSLLIGFCYLLFIQYPRFAQI